MLLLVLGSADGRNAMFAAMAGEAGCRSNEIAAMAAALPGRGERLSRADPAHSIWMDESGGFAAACRAFPLLPAGDLDRQPSRAPASLFSGRVTCAARP